MTKGKQLLPSELAFDIFRQKINADGDLIKPIKHAIINDLNGLNKAALEVLKEELNKEPNE